MYIISKMSGNQYMNMRQRWAMLCEHWHEDFVLRWEKFPFSVRLFSYIIHLLRFIKMC